MTPQRLDQKSATLVVTSMGACIYHHPVLRWLLNLGRNLFFCKEARGYKTKVNNNTTPLDRQATLAVAWSQ
jgi:hypothetical protein